MATPPSAKQRDVHPTGVEGALRPAPPAPSFILRGHEAPIHAIHFFASNTFLVSGDEAGWIVVWDLWKRRQIFKWHGHPTGSVLALQSIDTHSCKGQPKEQHTTKPTRRSKAGLRYYQDQARPVYIVSHGRDNHIHVWDINTVLQQSLARRSDGASRQGVGHEATLVFSLPVNALNFCKMSVLAIDGASETLLQKQEAPPSRILSLADTHRHIYIAVPSPTTSTLIDIYDIVKPERCFASVGLPKTSWAGESEKKTGSVMAIRLFRFDSSDPAVRPLGLHARDDTAADMEEASTVENSALLHMIVGYEDGSVVLYQENLLRSTNGRKLSGAKSKRIMDVVWTVKCHREPVLGVDLSSDMRFAVSVGSDNALIKYNLFGAQQGVPEFKQVPLKTNGIAEVKVRNDNRILALAGWDGRLRIFSARTLKPLAVLQHHREGLYCLDLAHIHEAGGVSVTDTGSTANINNDETQDDAGKHKESTQPQDIVSEDGSESESGSEDDSDEEAAVADRRLWSKRHWIAAGGKENRISLWEIY
ncbi:Guanine nucleotide binding protein (G protein), beta polypeptide 1-like [Mortierella alpina]|nr:Guanine nucleotide binding protein (G protein), beta polypeptide 1-like [Mortierella alpina]